MAGFMVLQVWPERAVELTKAWGDWAKGTILPDSIADANGCDAESIGERWFARYSAPGYMDQTDTVFAEGPITAARECFAIFGDNDHDSDDRRELAQVIRQARARGFRK